MTAQELLALDRRARLAPLRVRCRARTRRWWCESASGVRLRLAEPVAGHDELVDGMSSWWSAIHGYRHPALDAAARDQLGRMSHVMFGGLTHEPAVGLAARLVEITPEPLQHVFLCDSGSVSVEVAVKMCLQYWRARGRPERRRLLTWRGGYYGDTLSPMSLCDPEGGMHHLWSGILPAPGVRRRAARTASTRPPTPATSTHLADAGRGARRRARGDHRGAGGAGRGGHALPQPGLPAGPAGAGRRARRAAGLRRDRHGLRAQRGAVRGRRTPAWPPT